MKSQNYRRGFGFFQLCMKNPKAMRKATRDAILARAAEAFRAEGLSIDVEFAKVALKFLRRHQAPPDDFTTIMIATVWAALARELDTAEEPTAERLAAMLEEIKGIPHKLRKLAAARFREVVISLPKPHGGRPRKLTASQQREVRFELGKLDAVGVERQDAFERVARKYGVSPHTIERAWRARKTKQ